MNSDEVKSRRIVEDPGPSDAEDLGVPALTRQQEIFERGKEVGRHSVTPKLAAIRKKLRNLRANVRAANRGAQKSNELARSRYWELQYARQELNRVREVLGLEWHSAPEYQSDTFHKACELRKVTEEVKSAEEVNV